MAETIYTDWHGCYDESLAGLIVPDAFKHPAKMARNLAARIFDHGQAKGYWKPGDTILDPFGGVGITGLTGAYRGYFVIGVELEETFYELGQANIAKHRAHWRRLQRPAPLHIQGDSRYLAEIVGMLLAQPVGTITSPPYANIDTKPTKLGAGKGTRGSDGAGRNKGDYIYPTAAGQLGTMKPGTVGQTINNLGAITSPPFSEPGRQMTAGHQTTRAGYRNSERPEDETMRSPGNVADMKPGTVGQTINNLGVITSPPYADSINSASNNIDWTKAKPDYPGRRMHAERREMMDRNHTERRYGQTPGQIGATSGQTYWDAMAQVYSQLYAVLPSGSAAAIVVKDYVKKRCRIALCDDTQTLLEAIGFNVLERCRCWLVKTKRSQTLWGDNHTKTTDRKSFFRRLAEQKGSPAIDWEEVIWATKP